MRTARLRGRSGATRNRGLARLRDLCLDSDKQREGKIIQPATITGEVDLYGGRDPRDAPRYSFSEAAKATRIPASTLRAWTIGQRYRRKDDHGFFAPVLQRLDSTDSRLSFFNLIEAHVVRALRTVHDVDLGRVRYAVELAQKELEVERLLLDPRLKTSGGRLFLDRYTDLLELSPSQQIAMRSILDTYLRRVEYDESRLPAEFYPFEHVPENAGKRVIVIAPFVLFGRPLVQRVGVSTRAIVQRLDAGESVATILDDYGLAEAELEEAVLFETAA